MGVPLVSAAAGACRGRPRGAAGNGSGVGIVGELVVDADVGAERDAFVADENGRSGDQLADVMLALAAEAAIERGRPALVGLARRGGCLALCTEFAHHGFHGVLPCANTIEAVAKAAKFLEGPHDQRVGAAEAWSAGPPEGDETRPRRARGSAEIRTRSSSNH